MDSHLSPDPALLVSDVLGDVGESPQTLPQSYRPAGEKRGQRATYQEDRYGLTEGNRLNHGEDRPNDDEDDAEDPNDDQHRCPEPECCVVSSHLLLLPCAAYSTPGEVPCFSAVLERVMNSIRNGLGMRETEIAREPS